MNKSLSSSAHYPVPDAQCPMPRTYCPGLSAQYPLSSAQYPMPSAQYSVASALAVPIAQGPVPWQYPVPIATTHCPVSLSRT